MLSVYMGEYEGNNVRVTEDGNATIDSLATLEKKRKKLEKQRIARDKAAKAKILKQVETDKYAYAPADWKRHRHISELSNVAKPICTRFYYADDLRFPTFMCKVGRTWFKANSQLNKLLDKNPKLPFVIEVWDSGKTYNGGVIWNVELKPLS
jgi:hypothetical protein